MAKVRLDGVTKVFDEDIVAVDNMNLTIEDEELVVFLGPSGSGKSTALRLIAGLEKPSEGKIFIGGKDVTNDPPQRRDISMVFQSFALYPHRTVYRNISFPLEAMGMDEDEMDERIKDAAEVLEITELLDRKPGQLSGGQQQRVALGRALVRDPAAFLMDEPLANLDERLRKHMQAEMVRLQRDLATTMIHVTHNQEEAMTMGDRIVVMNKGQVQQVAPGRTAYREPANRFVAQFLGSPSMNMVEGQLTDGIFNARDADIGISFPEQVVEGVTRDVITVGVRPESLEVTDNASGVTLQGTIEVVELTGDQQVLHVDVDGLLIQVKMAADEYFEEGDVVTIGAEQDRLHVFDGIAEESPRVSQ